MIYGLCGVLIGSVMGLTGAGGALLAIPLFIHFLGMSLQEASVYSLLAVILASTLNFLTQVKSAQYPLAILIVLFSGMGSYLLTPYKEFFPKAMLVSLLVFVSIYATYSVWKTNTPEAKSASIARGGYLLAIPIGLGLGILTTLTGLGGGVMMMPIFVGVYFLDQPKALATSLLAVALSSLLSLFFQIRHGFNMPIGADLFNLTLGILFSALLLRWGVQKVSASKMALTRKIVFTAVAVFAVLKLL